MVDMEALNVIEVGSIPQFPIIIYFTMHYKLFRFA